MLYLTNKDKKVINSSYKSFLTNFKQIIKSKSIHNGLDCSKLIIDMLQSGQFSMEQSIRFDNQFRYLDFPNISSDGIYVMYGVCCCRHASMLVYDILQTLGFSSSLLYIFIDESNNWHISKPLGANHLTVLLKDHDCEYILDPVNYYILKKEKNNTLTSLNLDILDPFTSYEDSNIQKIGKVLKKYYQLQKLGIDYVYDY